jgi:hypothetical protein
MGHPYYQSAIKSAVAETVPPLAALDRFLLVASLPFYVGAVALFIIFGIQGA